MNRGVAGRPGAAAGRSCARLRSSKCVAKAQPSGVALLAGLVQRRHNRPPRRPLRGTPGVTLEGLRGSQVGHRRLLRCPSSVLAGECHSRCLLDGEASAADNPHRSKSWGPGAVRRPGRSRRWCARGLLAGRRCLRWFRRAPAAVWTAAAGRLATLTPTPAQRRLREIRPSRSLARAARVVLVGSCLPPASWGA